ncbi:3-hydroxybutyrate dehydrogenase [Phenylobacterium sp.]|uniref:3-hydroxybutyrate dehydrogenase n=1 Tax=Phenylobacterium sp. TaxID=1871053 RepID=UPI0011FF1B14|nr:3-hydroxybutyrate dehydrogenase [Phenylobacterium sp.]TAL36522.1 MAG: 3-hydroxybutyrate dehydrogenase [Phenylobacterium sp.]
MTMTALQNATTAPRPLQNRVAIVTGSTSGIGLGIAEVLAGQGANIVLNGFGDPNEIEQTRETLASLHGVEVIYSPADLSDPGKIQDMVAFARDVLGPIDILVNNAGIQHVAPVSEFPTAKWDAILAVNLSSAFHAIKASLPEMVERGYGRIINIASAHGLVASPYKSAYVAAKHGVVGLTKTVALEAARTGVTCNAICPGYVWTPLVEKQIADQARAHRMTHEQVITDVLLTAQPNRKFASVEEIGALAAFLCSENGASITGTALSVDGGWTAH